MEENVNTRILKSTMIVGGSSAITIGFRILASKVVALIVGPAGVGLLGLFNSVINLAGMVTGMGLANSSGVRRIAEMGDDENAVAKTILILRRLAIILGILGSVSFFLLRGPISEMTFGDDKYSNELGALSIVVFLMVISGMQTAFLRGMRRIEDIARVNVFGIVIGTLIGLPVIYFYKQAGIVAYLIAISITAFVIAWRYVHKLGIARVNITLRETYIEARGMMGLGVTFMLSNLVTLAVMYLVKVLVTRRLGLEIAGLYEASSALANVYVGFILGAMGSDFFPHLSAIAHNNGQSSRLMNAQVEIGLLVASPGILLVMALGPLLLQILYSVEFLPAFEILRWLVLGTFLRVVSWPLSYIILAKGRGKWYLGSELITNLVYLVCMAYGINQMGMAGIGAAFFTMYVFYTVLMIVLAGRLSGFRFNARNRFLLIVFLPAMALAFGVSLWLSSTIGMVINLALALIAGAYSLWSLHLLVGPAKVRTYLRRFQNKIGWKSI